MALAAGLLVSACGGGGGGMSSGGGGNPATPVVQAPTIKSQPVALSLTVGRLATFSVDASGDSLSYQWQRDGKDIAGATSASYTLNTVQLSDNGAKFAVVVKNAGGSVTSSAVTLTVTAAAPAPSGLSLLAGTLGGPGNIDGVGGRLAYPLRIALNPSGLLYVQDSSSALAWEGYSATLRGSGVLRTVNVASGEIATITTEARYTNAIAFDKAGNLYEAWSSAVYKTPPGGQRSLFAGSSTAIGEVDGAGGAARFTSIQALATDSQGNVYVGESAFLRKISPQGVVTTVAGGAGMDAPGSPKDGVGARASFAGITALAVDANDNVQVLDNPKLRVVTPAGAVSTRTLSGDSSITEFYAGNYGIAVDKTGNLYLTNTQVGCRIMKVAPDGLVTTLAGKADSRGSQDGKGTAASFCKDVSKESVSQDGQLSNLALDAAGNLYVGDSANMTVRRITPDGEVSTIAGRAPSVANVDGYGASVQFLLNNYNQRVGTNPYRAMSAYDLAADAQGNFYVRENDRIRKITQAGDVSTWLPQTIGLIDAGLYLGTVAFGGSPAVVYQNVISRVNADGSLAFLAGGAGGGVVDGTGARAGFYSTGVLYGDAEGNFYVYDYFPRGVESGAIVYTRKITPAGVVTTVTGGPQYGAMPADDGSTWYVSDLGEVTRVAANGESSLVRTLSSSTGARVVARARDRAGNLYVAWHEKPNWYAVHKITPAGVDTLIAGTAGQYGVRLGAPGSLGTVDALAVGADGNVYLISENAVLRIVQ